MHIAQEIFFIRNYAFIAIFIALFLSLLSNKNIDRSVRRMFFIMLGMAVFDAFFAEYEVFLRDNFTTYQYGRVVASVICYIMKPAILYMVCLVMLRENEKRMLKIGLATPLLICSIIISSAFYSEQVFYFTADNVYHTGPLSFFTYGVLLVYLLILLVLIIRVCRANWMEAVMLLLILVFITANIILSLLTDYVSFDMTTIAVSIMAYYLFFQAQAHIDTVQQGKLEAAEREAKHTESMLIQMIRTLSYTVDAKDKYTNGHSVRVARYAGRLAYMAGMEPEDCQNVYYTGMLHDIGKISIPDDIINKEGSLSKSEYEIIKSHPIRGAEILQQMKEMPFLEVGAHWHHERFDGKGYPDGLAGEAIPEMARIIAVADAYDAMTSKRSYRDVLPQDVVRAEIEQGRGTQFDPKYADFMLQLIDADTNYKLREE